MFKKARLFWGGTNLFNRSKCIKSDCSSWGGRLSLDDLLFSIVVDFRIRQSDLSCAIFFALFSPPPLTSIHESPVTCGVSSMCLPFAMLCSVSKQLITSLAWKKEGGDKIDAIRSILRDSFINTWNLELFSSWWFRKVGLDCLILTHTHTHAWVGG